MISFVFWTISSMKNFLLLKFFLIILSTSQVMATERYADEDSADFSQEDIPTRERQDHGVENLVTLFQHDNDVLKREDIEKNRKHHDEENLEAKIKKDEKDFARIQNLEKAYEQIAKKDDEMYKKNKALIEELDSQIPVLKSRIDQIVNNYHQENEKKVYSLSDEADSDAERKKMKKVEKEIEANKKIYTELEREIERLGEESEKIEDYSNKIKRSLYYAARDLANETRNLEHKKYLEEKYHLSDAPSVHAGVDLSDIQDEDHLEQWIQNHGDNAMHKEHSTSSTRDETDNQSEHEQRSENFDHWHDRGRSKSLSLSTMSL